MFKILFLYDDDEQFLNPYLWAGGFRLVRQAKIFKHHPNYMKKVIYLTILLSTGTILSFAQTKDDGQRLIDHFFELYQTKGHEPALNYAFGTNKWIDSQGDGIKTVILELDKNLKLIGNYIGQEEIKSKTVGSRFRIASYFVYYDRQPLRFTFELYKNSEGWMLWNFEFDSNYDGEIEEAMKLFRFKELSDWN